MKRAYIETKEGQIHYRYDGSGEPLLLLHQVAWSSEEYTKLLPILAKSYRVVAMDILGYGVSDHPPYEYQIHDYARSVVEFLNALQVKRTNVFGHHTGALIGVELAAGYPERVDKLVVSGCPCFKNDDKRLPLFWDKFESMKIDPYGSHLLKIWHTLRDADFKAPVDLLENFAENYIKASLRGEEAHWAVFRYDARVRLPLIQSPTLAISGTRDTFLKDLDDIKSLVNRCRTLTIKGGGAFICQSYPNALARAITDFLKAPDV